ncbi:TIGR02300 family protein [Ferrovibrio sp.]|uniref:TIGR02300 family protein n=1 Tax=Ferrovibrio sp. TaxID=1917215 RepID=UPI000CCAB990|nr:TIGR02300 family protein [Ferrovibrio sp.]PJI37479.1 MAG: TIGR02300 family protein [Ferrovibrio sp.]
MAKAEWGAKRRCLSCGAAFYDLNKSPITCPKCGTDFNPDVLMKTSRRPAKVEEPKKVVPKAPAPDAIDDEVEDTGLGDDILEDADEFEEDDVAEEIDVDAQPDGDEER